jgi:hypothetical protein
MAAPAELQEAIHEELYGRAQAESAEALARLRPQELGRSLSAITWGAGDKLMITK